MNIKNVNQRTLSRKGKQKLQSEEHFENYISN